MQASPDANHAETIWLVIAFAGAVLLFVFVLAMFVVSRTRRSRGRKVDPAGFGVPGAGRLKEEGMTSNGEEPAVKITAEDVAIVAPAPAMSLESPAEAPSSCGAGWVCTAATQLGHRAGILGWFLLLGAIGAKVAGSEMPMLLALACAAGLVGILASLLMRFVATPQSRSEFRGILIYNAALFIPSLVWLGLMWRHLHAAVPRA